MTPTPTFEERLAALEAAHIDLNDLPLAALQRKLELDWRPAASVLLGDSSITPSMLSFLTPASGRTTGIYTTGATALQTVAHGLGRAPKAVIVGTAFKSGVGYFAGAVDDLNWDATNFHWGGWQLNGSIFNGGIVHSWWAI